MNWKELAQQLIFAAGMIALLGVVVMKSDEYFNSDFDSSAQYSIRHIRHISSQSRPPSSSDKLKELVRTLAVPRMMQRL